MLSIAKYGIVTEVNLSVQNCLVGIDTLSLIVWFQNTEADRVTFSFIIFINEFVQFRYNCGFAPPTGYTDELHNHTISEV